MFSAILMGVEMQAIVQILLTFIKGAMLSAILLVWLWNWDPNVYFKGRPFNQKVWRDAVSKGDLAQALREHECIRGPMFEDLRSYLLQNNFSKEEVVLMLGNRLRPRECWAYSLRSTHDSKDENEFINICFSDYGVSAPHRYRLHD